MVARLREVGRKVCTLDGRSLVLEMRPTRSSAVGQTVCTIMQPETLGRTKAQTLGQPNAAFALHANSQLRAKHSSTTQQCRVPKIAATRHKRRSLEAPISSAPDSIIILQ